MKRTIRGEIVSISFKEYHERYVAIDEKRHLVAKTSELRTPIETFVKKNAKKRDEKIVLYIFLGFKDGFYWYEDEIVYKGDQAKKVLG